MNKRSPSILKMKISQLMIKDEMEDNPIIRYSEQRKMDVDMRGG